MGFVELFLLAVGLSMDAFSVAVCKGLGMRQVNWRVALALAVAFGGSRLLARLVPDEATRLEGLFLINLFLLLLCVAATGAITF